jgi:hypothetical protein
LGKSMNGRALDTAHEFNPREPRNHADFIWSVADLLRGDYKRSEYGKVVLPLTVLRRLDGVLAPTKQRILDKHKQLARGGIESVRTNAVAREAGVSSALIFYYFGTRQELLRQAFEYADAWTETPGLRGDDAESPAIETIERTLLGQVDNAKVVRENWVLWSASRTSRILWAPNG